MKSKFTQSLVLLILFISGTATNLFSQICNGSITDYITIMNEGNETTAAAGFNVETNAEGKIIITLSPQGDNTDVWFRGNGINEGTFEKIEVGGEANIGSRFFTRKIDTNTKVLILTPAQTIAKGTIVKFPAVCFEYGTTGFGNLWPNLDFSILYGIDCASAPSFTTSKQTLELNPGQLSETFTLTGVNLLSDLSLTATSGLSVTPVTITPQQDGSITDQTIEVKWDGTITNGTITISGGGILTNTQIPVVCTNFSPYCSYLLSQDDAGEKLFAYMTVHMSEDNKTMKFIIAPYNEQQSASWKDNSISAAGILVDGQAPAVEPTRTMGNKDTEIIITFNEALTDGQVVTFGGPMVWRVVGGENPNDNCFINAAKTFTVGDECVGSALPQVNVSKTSLTLSPNKQVEKFLLSGANLSGEITLTASTGIKISESALQADTQGAIAEQTISVVWDGLSTEGSITITGGMIAPVIIPVTPVNFSPYCETLLSQNNNGVDNLAYMTINMSADNTVMKFIISPAVDGQTTTWNANSIPASKILIDGELPATAPTWAREDNNTVIVLTFSEALTDGQIITFGAPMVWTIEEDGGIVEGNCFIDPAKTFTVGDTCPADLSVSSIGEVTDITDNSAKVNVSVAGPALEVLLKEDNEKTADFKFEVSESGVYSLTGLAYETAYSFSVYAIDMEGNLSDAYSEKIAFTTLYPTILSVESVSSASDITKTTANVTVEISEGYFASEKVRFTEDNNKVQDIVLNA